MEERRGTLTHFSRIIRLIAFIILVLIILFFIFRWVASRRAEQRAEQAAKTAVTSGNREKTKSDKNSEQKKPESTSGNSTNIVEVPSGVADSDTSKPDNVTQPNQSVPATGTSFDILAVAIFLSVSIYLLVRNNILRQQIQQSN